MSYGCLCGAPDCPSCGPLQGWHVHTAHCWDEDGLPGCGQTAYHDEDPCCDWCGEPSAPAVCSTCQARAALEHDQPRRNHPRALGSRCPTPIHGDNHG